MNDSNNIHVKHYNSSTGQYEDIGDTLSTYTLARSMTIANFTSLMDNFLNLGGKGFREGKECGSQMRAFHRTLQRLAICFVLGIVDGLSEQKYTDDRNAAAILTAQKIKQMTDQGDLPLGPYL